MALVAACSSGTSPIKSVIGKRGHRFVVLAAGGGDDDAARASQVTTQPEDLEQVKGESASPQFRARRFHVSSDRWLAIVGASLGLPLRLGTGVFVQGYKASLVPKEQLPPSRYSFGEFAGRKVLETSQPGPRPQQPIQLYEFEACPFCRKVREVTSYLDLDILYLPCPKDGPTFRPKAVQLGGKKQFPYMVDPNTGVSMYESDHIIKYLVDKYGDGRVPIMLSLGVLTTLTAGFAMLARGGKGSKYVLAKKADKPLELWAYEASPFCQIVRETLVELELPHMYHNAARGSPKRDDLLTRTGIFQVPYLEDPNTGTRMFESSAIIDYLQRTYAL